MDINQQIEEIAKLPLNSFKGMEMEDRINGTSQMVSDLERLAIDDGCIAAAFALDLINVIANLNPVNNSD
ncbi:hypothetical protein [Synechocystis salina]|uniref:Uncharacterized protein n=1 Tax=Synechocystis salina LEGE 00031 TaxID=1828736 RepID=A0ABR9VRU3_9SYNC|nr:hypothetical protein [Synechocystis salina]MBE9242767.1 hypothetical protein [Synechocystis salina LEGE 00041]MBE9254052.1 hypothetical protein [Synechocystis salina LEGE 00031]